MSRNTFARSAIRMSGNGELFGPRNCAASCNISGEVCTRLQADMIWLHMQTGRRASEILVFGNVGPCSGTAPSTSNNSTCSAPIRSRQDN